MEQDKIINKSTIPEAIIILSGGSVCGRDGNYHSTTYNDGDSFGILGGYARVEAASILAKKYPEARVVATGKGALDKAIPSHAKVMESELKDLGIDPSRIILEEKSTNSINGLLESITLAEKSNWRQIVVISNEYHIPRMSAIWETMKNNVNLKFIAAEDVIISNNPEFNIFFSKLKKTPAYIKRLESEIKGLEAFRAGTYKPADPEDKKERLV